MGNHPPRRWPALALGFPPEGPGAGGLPPGAEAIPIRDLAAVILDDHAPTAIDESPGASSGWRVFFSTDADRQTAADALRAALGPRGLTVQMADVEDEDWAARSQATLRAIRVGDLVVAPPWDTDVLGERWRVTILPSMGFGTGHHESTRLCLHALQHLSLAGTSVVDVGTGSGVLAIAAAALGAGRVLGVDHDPDAVEAARDGLMRNACADRVSLRQASLDDLRHASPADVVLANLTSAPLIRDADVLSRLVSPGGALIVSGFTSDEESSVRAAFGILSVGRRDEEGAWVALTLRAPVASSEIAPREEQHR